MAYKGTETKLETQKVTFQKTIEHPRTLQCFSKSLQKFDFSNKQKVVKLSLRWNNFHQKYYSVHL